MPCRRRALFSIDSRRATRIAGMKRKSPINALAFLRRMALALVLAVMLAGQALGGSLEEAAERVARQHDAQVISAREVERDGQIIYVIRILTKDGVVRTIRVPARRR